MKTTSLELSRKLAGIEIETEKVWVDLDVEIADYGAHLHMMTQGGWVEACKATTEQKAEALAKALGIWTDDMKEEAWNKN